MLSPQKKKKKEKKREREKKRKEKKLQQRSVNSQKEAEPRIRFLLFFLRSAQLQIAPVIEKKIGNGELIPSLLKIKIC